MKAMDFAKVYELSGGITSWKAAGFGTTKCENC
jgi:rhodanese-related sulfurtransferase